MWVVFVETRWELMIWYRLKGQDKMRASVADRATYRGSPEFCKIDLVKVSCAWSCLMGVGSGDQDAVRFAL